MISLPAMSSAHKVKKSYTLEDMQRRERSAPIVRDNEPHETWRTAFSYRRHLVILTFATARFCVAVCSDVAKTADEAKTVALGRARRNDPMKKLGRLVSMRVHKDTDENRRTAGVDTHNYDKVVEWQNRWYERPSLLTPA